MKNKHPALPEEAKATGRPSITDPADICPVVSDLLPLYAEGLTSATSTRLVEDHLKDCPECRKALEALHAGEVQSPPPTDPPMEDALRKVNRKFHRHRALLVTLGVVIVALAIAGGALLSKILPVRASSVNPSVPQSYDDTLSLVLESPFGKMFNTGIQDLGDGKYALSGSSFQFQQGPLYSNTFVLQQPVQEVTFNGDVVYQDGVVITEGARQNFPRANGYAGDTSQMSLAMPMLSAKSFHIEADTSTPERCAWDYVLNPADGLELTLSEDEKYILRCNALLALALTPNLETVRYRGTNGTPALEVSRMQLIDRLKEHGMDDRIETLADMQRVMSIVLPPAG